MGRVSSPAAEVQAFLAGLEDGTRAIVDALREVVRRTVPDATETVLWGGLSYHTPRVGGRVKGAVCQIGTKGGEVRLEFIHGVRLADPRGLLSGDRRSKRYVPIRTEVEARRPEIRALIQEASTIDLVPGP